MAGVMTGLGAVYILSLVAFCVCGFVCGWCTLKHKEFIQHTVTSYKAERQAYMMHPPPRHPAPVYEDTKLQPDESDSELHLVNAASHESEQQAYSTTLKCPTLVYENVSPVHGEAKSEQQAYSKCPTLAYENVSPLHGEAKTSTIEIQLQDLEMKKNVAYGPVRD